MNQTVPISLLIVYIMEMSKCLILFDTEKPEKTHKKENPVG